MATNVWGVPPAPTKSDWADSVDQDEAANGGQLPELPTIAAPLGGDSAFPSLGEASKPAPKKKGRNKGTTLALSEFQAGSAAPPKPARPAFRSASAAASRDKAGDIMATLPKGPRERDENEEKDKLGGGFQDYSGAKARGGRRRDDDDEEGPRRMEDLGPSKADESADWGADRKPQSAFGGGGGFGDRERAPRTSGFGGDSAAADSAESWGSRRPAGSSAAPPRRAGGAFGGFDKDEPMGSGGGFVPSDRPPRRAGFDEAGGPSKADEESRWGSRFTPGEPRRAPSAGADEASSWASRRPPTSAGDAPAAGPTSRPRLNLKPRTAPVPETPSQSGDSSQHGGSSVKSGDGAEDEDAPAPAPAAPPAPRSNPFGGAKPRDERLLAPARDEPSEPAEPAAAAAPAAAPAPRSNPFGSARPREEVLRQQGRAEPDAPAPRPESAEEAELRQKIEGLKLRVQEGEGETEIEVPALSSAASQPNGQAKPSPSTSQPAEPVSGKEAADMAKQAVEQASSEATPTGNPEQNGVSASEADNGSAAAAEASPSAPKMANAWARKPSLQLQTTVQEYLADCEGKLKQLSTRLDAEARQAPQPSGPDAPASKPAPSRW